MLHTHLSNTTLAAGDTRLECYLIRNADEQVTQRYRIFFFFATFHQTQLRSKSLHIAIFDLTQPYLFCNVKKEKKNKQGCLKQQLRG